MAKRNILKHAAKGRDLARNLKLIIGADEAEALVAACNGDVFQEIVMTYNSGLSVGYEKRKKEDKRRFKADVEAWLKSLERADIEELQCRLGDLAAGCEFNLDGMDI